MVHLLKATLLLFLFGLLATACEPSSAEQITSIPTEDWARRTVTILPEDSLQTGSTYLSSYSQVYVQSNSRTFSLTGTISMRNINEQDTIYIDKANYYKTNGGKIRSYFSEPIYLAPLETVEIIIAEDDVEGGTGDNFVFEWHKPAGSHDPFFEGIFITTYGQQGISFATRGIRIK